MYSMRHPSAQLGVPSPESDALAINSTRKKCQFVSMWGVVCCARRIPMKNASLRTCMGKLGPKSMLVNIL